MKARLFLLAILMLGVLMSGCVTAPQDATEFQFVFKYGAGPSPRNVLNTAAGTYTRDMVIPPDITVHLALSEAEVDAVYKKMREIDFFSYPDRFEVTVPPGDLVTMVTPNPNYYFKVTYDSDVKELSWADSIRNPDARADKLRELIRLIQGFIESKDEYKELPQPRAGYM